MPLVLRVERDGKNLRSNKGFHLMACIVASSIDRGTTEMDAEIKESFSRALNGEGVYVISPGTCEAWATLGYPFIAATPLGDYEYVITNGTYKFEDTTDNEIFTLTVGDKITAYRS